MFGNQLLNSMRKLLYLIIVVLATSGCNKEIKHALEKAGENRAELEKVLEYFANDSDPLKYEAAKFLIENMPSQSQLDN